MISNVKVEFNGAVYCKDCLACKGVAVGSILCTGAEDGIPPPCGYYVSHQENNVYKPTFLKEDIPIVSMVQCSNPIWHSILDFDINVNNTSK